VNNRSVILLLLLGFCFGCGKDESFLKNKIFFCVDDVDEKTAPFSVVLGSYKTDEDPQYDELEEMPNHLTLVDQAGTAILWNGHIWHIALHNMYELDSHYIDNFLVWNGYPKEDNTTFIVV